MNLGEPPVSTEVSAPQRLPWQAYATVVVLGAAVCLALVAAKGPALFYELPHYAEIARHLARGDGFVTGLTTPSALAGYLAMGAVDPPWPVVDRFLGHALAAALFVRCGVDPVWAVVLVDALAVGVLLATTAALAHEVGGRRAGLIALVLAATNPLLMCSWAQGGLADPPFAACTSLLLLLVVRHGRCAPSWRASILAGAVAGAALLLRYNFVVWLPAVVVLWWRTARPRGLAHVAVATAAAAVVAGVPFLAVWIGGSVRPSYVVGTWNWVADVVTKEEPWTLFRVWHAEEALAGGPGPLLRKAAGNFVDVLASAWDLFRAPLVVLCAVVGSVRREARRVVALATLLMVPHVLMFVATRAEATLGSVWQDRYLAPAFAPVVVVAALLLTNIGRHRLGRWLAGAVVIASASAMPLGLLDAGELPTRAGYWGRDVIEGESATRPIMANAAFPIAYLFDRPAVYLPASPDEALTVLGAVPMKLVIVDFSYTVRPAWMRALQHDRLRDFAAASGLTETVLGLDDAHAVGAMALRPGVAASAPPPP